MHEQLDQQKPHNLPRFLMLEPEHRPPTKNSPYVVNHKLEILHEQHNTWFSTMNHQ